MANPAHLGVVKQGTTAIQEWRASNPRSVFDLSGADLRKADLRQSNLCTADLSKAYLCKANLSRAKLVGTELD